MSNKELAQSTADAPNVGQHSTGGVQMRAYFDIFRMYAVFRGRASRLQYWYFTIITSALLFLLWELDSLLGLMRGGAGLLSTVCGLATALPLIAVSVRRMHDTGRSGWWVLIEWVPVVGTFWALGLYLQPSQPGDNAYGPSPHAGQAAGRPTSAST